ncbi:MAG: phosphatidate cytidylyltransferase [Oscillospiraceae bacterium]|nr:phosphatidate cytidylyltransferase [Oscillospiraceae bacterium]
MKQRVTSAIILLTITLSCVLAHEISRVLFFAIAGILCCYEYSRAVEKLEVYCAAWVMYTYIAAQALLTLFHQGPILYIGFMMLGIYLAMFSGILHKKVTGKGAIFTLAGLAYPGFLFGILMMISVGEIWQQALFLATAATMVCDSFALFGGMAFGKHKLAPLVSPKKTWEGAICGALSSLAVGLIIYLLPIFPELNLSLCLITCFLASSMGQIGDLAESLVKRMINIKDFSNLIPGHGGMFDRADSLLFSIPTAYIVLHIAGIGV